MFHKWYSGMLTTRCETTDGVDDTRDVGTAAGSSLEGLQQCPPLWHQQVVPGFIKQVSGRTRTHWKVAPWISPLMWVFCSYCKLSVVLNNCLLTCYACFKSKPHDAFVDAILSCGWNQRMRHVLRFFVCGPKTCQKRLTKFYMFYISKGIANIKHAAQTADQSAHTCEKVD